MKISSSTIKLYSILMCVLVVAGAVLASALRKNAEPFDIGDYAAFLPAESIAAYEASPTPEGLAKLCHILCYHYKNAGDETIKADFLHYGALLKNGAKEGNWDLEKLDTEDHTLLKVLEVLQDEGVR